MKQLLFILCLALTTFAARAQIEISNLIEVQVTSVFDGDGFNVKFPGKSIVDKIRLVGIDAPERRGYSFKTQPYGDMAGDTLRALVLCKKILLDTLVQRVNKRDVYGRILASAYTLDTVSVQFYMVEKGLAWAERTPGLKDPRLNDVLEFEMKAAKTEKRGLWKSYITADKKTARIFKPSTWRKNYAFR